MSTPAARLEEAASAYGLDPFLPQDEATWQEMYADDTILLAELAELNSQTPPVYSTETRMNFSCGELAGLVRKDYDAGSFSNLEQFLVERGTLDIPIVKGKVTVGGIERNVSMVAATETGADGASHGEMSSMLYLRDQIQTASALMELALGDPAKYAAEGKLGKELLISALHLMSTESQLARFDNVIRLGKDAQQSDWPHISLHFNDLEGKRPNGWRNKQDTLQMLAYATLDALDRGFLDADELAVAHKQSLASVMPLLKAAGFPHYESSGSWEENEAVRSSVMAVETAMLWKMQQLAEQGKAGFLEARNADSPGSFEQTLDEMAWAGLYELGKRLPYESPDYAEGSIKFRDNDAALIYVLRYGLPQLLAEHNIPMAANGGKPMTAKAIEEMMLEQIFELVDPETGGIYRYDEDSYQRLNFHTNVVQAIIKAIKQKVQYDALQNGTEIDLDEKQWLRGELTPKGKPPVWTHFLGQLGGWAAKRSREEGRDGNPAEAAGYKALSTHCMNAALSLVTGDNQYNLVLDQNGRYRIRQVPAGKLPECLVEYATYGPHPTVFRTPSSHTPLNWSTAMTKETVGLLGMCLEQPAA